MSLASVGPESWDPSAAAQPSKDKENTPSSNPNAKRIGGGAEEKKKLSPRWIFNAAMLSSPCNLEQLVALSRDAPLAILNEVGLLNMMVDKCLNAEKSSKRVDKDTRLDVLVILANIAKLEDVFVKEKVQKVLAGVSSWFEKYVEETEAAASREGKRVDPELHKAMLLLLSRAFSYSLKTENLLELCGGDRRLALESVLGILEDGEVVVTEIAPAITPEGGQRGQWEQREARIRHEKELVVQMCSLLLGFTRADTYFSELEEGFYFMEAGLELPEYCIDQFSLEIDSLLDLTLRTKLVEKLCMALNLELFSDGKVLDNADHQAVISVNGFLQNLYLYGCENTEAFRHHLLSDTMFVPHVVIPYLERCVYHAAVMTRKASANRAALGDFEGFDDMPGVAELVAEVSDLSLDHPELCHGVEATLRTLIICSFRAPRTRLMFQLLQRFNPTASLLRMKSFVARHDYLFSLLLLLNVNMGAFDITAQGDDYFGQDGEKGEKEGDSDDDDGHGGEEDACDGPLFAYAMLSEVLDVYDMMDEDKQRRVLRRVEFSGALPVARDCPSYNALVSLLWGGGNSGIGLLLASTGFDFDDEDDSDDEEDSDEGGDKQDSDDDDEEKEGGLGVETPGRAQPEEAVDFSETQHFKLCRADAKADSAARMQERQDDDEMDQLCSKGGEGSGSSGGSSNKAKISKQQASMAKIMAKSGALQRKPALGETWSDELAEMDDELERLDALVAADLRACQEDMWALEQEVRELRLNEEMERGLQGLPDDEDDDDDSDDDNDEDDEEDDGILPVTSALASLGGSGGGGGMSVAAIGARSPPISSSLCGSFGGGAFEQKKGEGGGAKEETKEGSSNVVADVAEAKQESQKSEAKGEVAGDTKSTKQQQQEDPEIVVPTADADSALIVAETKTPPSSSSLAHQGEEKPATAEGHKDAVSSNSASTPQVPTLQLSGSKNSTNNTMPSKKSSRASKAKTTGRSGKKDKSSSSSSSNKKPEEVVQLTARSRRSLLGDLPSLQNKRHTKEDLDTFLNLKLQVPTKAAAGHRQGGAGGGGGGGGYLSAGGDSTSAVLSPSGKRVNNGVPEELACAINGHLMKDPVRAPSGLVFERATILLWLERNGSVCPISGSVLVASDLTADAALRTKIMRRHIAKSMEKQEQPPPQSSEGVPESEAQSAGNGGSAFSDDLYDF